MIIIILISFSTNIIATDLDPDDYKPSDINTGEIAPVTNIASSIVDTIALIGIIVSVIALIAIGLKYMMGSVAEKAEYKKTMIPYLIGVVMVTAITQFLKIIVTFVSSIE